MSNLPVGSVPAGTLPTGTITFLFTDIEGSTRLWEEHPQEMRAALVRHDQLIEEIVGRYDGVVVRPRGEGDSRFAVFRRASDAVLAAVALQQTLYSEPWPLLTPLQVRMALHAGEADLREGDYYGSAVNRCARLRSIAHGGQTLVSAITQELVRDDLPEAVTLRDLGEHHLRDLQRPEHVFQIVAPGLPADFPSLKSLDILPNNLPMQLTSFIGREREIEEIKRLLSATPREHALLTLTGPGGTGKTRLALQVAADLLDAYPDGVWLVELAPVADAALVPQAIASVLTVREVAGIPLVQTLTEHLRPKIALLLLDNCEHLIEKCAQIAEALLRACPSLSMLASSREPLGIAGELPYRVPSLSLPDSRNLPTLDTLTQYEAVRLFVERARLVQPSFALTEQNAPAVAEICRRLDGIPLAIELAAARVKILSVEQIAERLDDRFRLLTGGSRTAMPRQQTLRAAMDWSYDLLSKEEQLLLRWLSVFMGSWSLEAAEAVCAGQGSTTTDVLDLLAHLVDKSLVVVEQQAASEEEVRYRLLETIRQYALDKLLEAGETVQVRNRHLEYFLKVAEEFEPKTDGPVVKAALDRLEAEHDNMRAALEWSQSGSEAEGATGGDVETALRQAAALGPFWWWRGYLTEGRQWLERALALPGSTGQDADGPIPAARGKALTHVGALVLQQGDTELARMYLEESVSIRRRLGDSEGLALSLHFLGHVTFDQIDFAGARSLFEESLSIYQQLGARFTAPYLVGDLGMVAYNVGDYSTARLLLEQCLSEQQEMQLVEGKSEILIRLGDVARSEGDYDHAAELYEQSLEQQREFGNKLGTASALHKLAQVVRHRGDYEKAGALLKESLGMQREAGNKQGIAECLAALAGLVGELGHIERAARLFGAVDALLEQIKVPLTPADRDQHDRDLAASKQSGSEPAQEAAWQDGRTMSMEQAITYALEDSDGQ